MFELEILLYGKLKLFDEDLFESADVVLFVEDEHGFFVVNGIYRTETQRAIAVGNQYGITGNTGCAFVAVSECLDI